MEGEAEKLRQLRAKVGALPDDLVVSGDDTAALRRFLVARKWDVEKAEGQLRRTLAWRANEFGVLPFLANPPLGRLALVRSLLPSNPHLGFTKAGFPISCVSLASADLVAMARDLTVDDVVADFVVRAEFYRAIVFPEATARAGGRIVDKEVVVLDVGGVSLGILKIMPLFKAVNSVGSSYFPERTVHILVLNAPRVFASLWSILQKLVDPRTQKKVVILSGGDKQFNALRTYMEDQDIPQAFGGARAQPHTSGQDMEATASIYARLDKWLAQCCATKAPAAAQPADVLQALAAATPRARPSLDACEPRTQHPLAACPPPQAGAPREDETRTPSSPRLAPGQLARRSSCKLSPLTLPKECDAPAPQRSPGELRNTLCLVLLWLASTVMFSLAAWAQLAAAAAAAAQDRGQSPMQVT